MFIYGTLILLILIHLNSASYGIQQPNNDNSPQSDVGAPAYVPAYARNRAYGAKTGNTGLKRSYSGTKTNHYSGTKTGYSNSGTKNSYSGTKTGYTGTKTGSGYGSNYYSNYGSTPTEYEAFHNHAGQPYAPICEPDCQNNGICIATGICNCPPNFYGHRCQLEKKPCMTYPPLPMNSHRKCSSEYCTITCAPGHQFIDGTSVANMRCVEGQWQPTRADFTAIPDCVPTCDPPCLNGGACLSYNVCQCPQAYRGSQCQYSASDCDVRKLSFNGAYSCSGDGEKFSCRLSCPAGAGYSTPPAELYTCLYSTGSFAPQPIPRCVFNDVVIITPSHQHNYSESNTYYETHQESENSHSQSSYGHSGYGQHSGYGHHSGYGQHSGYGDHSEFGHAHQETSDQTLTIVDYTPKDGTCFTWGGTHYKTFDGKVYSFQSSCQHILVRDAKEHKFTVTVNQGKCKRQFYCPSELSIFLEDKQYFFSVGEEGGVVFRSTRRLLPIPATLPGIRVSMPKDTVIITLDGLGATIKWDTNNLIMIDASILLWNNTEGLCGNLDGREETDLITRDKTIAKTTSALASSWQLNKIGEICESSPTSSSSCKGQPQDILTNSQSFCTALFTKEKFRKCSRVMDLAPLLEACQWDYCACTANQSPEDCACNTIAVYARECLRSGVEEMKSWRDKDTCPMKCPEGKVYKACGPDTQPSCASPTTVSKVDNSTCFEGCYCPEGLFSEEGLCVPKEECPCRLRAKIFKPGAVVPKDCNTCTCQAGEWTCTQVACGARCGAVGDPHYTTFDGLRYDFMGHCTYDLVRTDNLTIEVENVACSGAISEAMNLVPSGGSSGKPSCTKAINLSYGGTSIHLKQGGFILVNGKEVTSLPIHVGDVCIRAASSLFIVVELPIDVDLWWDGNTRVFVDVPPELRDKTKGLCGTFNQNQKDDFLTPEGDVEQTALAFANKWKTREFCEDVDLSEPEHPCKANVENKEIAEKYCSKLKSKLFQECHWHVDVEPYYEECLYDVCACEGDVSRCLCPILGDYAMTCAKSGIKIQWRYNVKECELSCSGGQEYTVCADSCQRTCSDVAIFSSSDRCKPTCVEGCACAPGQVLDAAGQCVPIGLCPCYHKGLQFNPGYKEVRPGRRERELCICVGAKWDCRPATAAEIQNYPPAEDLRLNCSAAHHQEFTTCEIAEPLTCKNMHLPPSSTTAECRPGCQCKKGFVLDTTSKKCILPTECPCHHGGQSFPDGHTMQEECNTCECKRGNWTCTQKKCVGVCSAWGDSHFTTFDGKEYDFEGVCTYLMAKGVMETGKDGFDVEIQNVPCGTTGATCSKSVTLKVGYGDNVESVTLTKDTPLPDISKLKRIQLRVAGAFVFLDVPSLAVTLQWDRAMRVYVKVDPMWENRLKGLCGNYNYDQRDDFQTPSGGGVTESSALIFADSWKLKPTCPKPEAVRDHCQQRPERREWATSVCGAMKRDPFTKCHTEVPPSDYVARCERDACACDSGADCECACTALAAYAQLCSSRGVEVRWRSQLLCPMQCDEECSTYDACVPACPLETCDNTLNYEEIKRSCARDTCIEGCKPKKSCAEGTVYSNNSHTACVPRAQCRPVCMALADGREVLEGEVLDEDACHTCRCSQKQRVCTGQPCSTEPPVISTMIPTQAQSPKPHDEPLKCVTGWTSWISKSKPEPISSYNSESIDNEPLPSPKDLQIGSPMCNKEKITKIECRTVIGHKTPKETGLNVECSLERGLICKETRKQCLDFEIRVYCECENEKEPFQCLDSAHPNHPHPSDCHKFYECTPDPMSPERPHAVLKTCGDAMMYNPVAMVCDWPASVAAIRPECADVIESREPATTPIVIETAAPTIVTTSVCPPGQVYTKCMYPCDKMCDYFLKTLQKTGKCTEKKDCIGGCVNEQTAKIKCGFGSMWRDEQTCVPIKDCTCYSGNGAIKPGGVDVEGCIKCQCLDNKYHCDRSDCVSTIGPINTATPNQPLISTESLVSVHATPPSTPPTTVVHTTVTTPIAVKPILIVKTTVSPPPECNPDRYKNLLWEGDELPNSAFSASSIASELFAPQYAVLDGHPLDITAGSWNPATMDDKQYIQVELPRREPVYGVIMQGSPLFDQFVTSYEIMYGDDGNVFSTVNGPDDKAKVFRGPVDHNNPVKQMIEPPIEAKFLRIRPLTWHEEIAVRFELIGCGEAASTQPQYTQTTVNTPLLPVCIDPLGLEAGLPVSNIEVSSNPEAAKYLDLKEERGWRPLYSTPGEWIMFDFTDLRNITGVKTKGGDKGWITAYNVYYATNLTVFNPVIDETGSNKVFPGNFDKDTEVVNHFRPPLHARYFKILPLKWHNIAEIRIEPLGCYLPYPATTPPPPVEEGRSDMIGTPPSDVKTCELCPGVQTPKESCKCGPPHPYFDGEDCTDRALCPCFISFMPYAVGATFRGANCDECVCKLGGVTDCKPVKECKCAPDLVPKLSPSNCECVCEPCPAGTKICPTSHMCLGEESWCDGLVDCPDDETNCTTVAPIFYETTVAPTTPTAVTTEAPKQECPKVECPPGYFVRYSRSSPTHSSYSSTSDLPPPRPRKTYQRYQKGTKGGGTKGGYSGSKGGPQTVPRPNQAFNLDKPSVENLQQNATKECAQFKCVPNLPPLVPGATRPPLVCVAPKCPPKYTLTLDTSANEPCPQYVCVPPPERPVFCNVTGRTFNTFDGSEYKYDLCFHILARDNRFDTWTVLVRKKCTVDSCVNELLVRQDDEFILVKPNLMIEYDNYEYTYEQTSMICFQKNSFDIDKLGNGLAISSRRYKFVVYYYTNGDVKIGVYNSHMGAVDGMCGAFDGDASNDRRLPNGQQALSVDEFGRAWAKPGLPPDACRARVIPPQQQKETWETCSAVTEAPLSACSEVLNLDKWRGICLEKICECADIVVNGTKRTREECRCELLEQFVAECLAADKNLDLSSWRMDMNCPAECPPPLVHNDCYRKRCEPTCSTLGSVTRQCPLEDGQCFSGCYCPEGKLRKGDDCVTPTECRDCVCNGIGSPAKYVTFERDDLPFGGNCTYLAARDKNATGHHKFQVYASNGPCENSTGIVCTKAVHLLYEKNIIHVQKNNKSDKLEVTINGKPVYKYPTKNDFVTVSLVNGRDVTILVPDVQLEITVLQEKMEFIIRLPSYVYANKTEGLCGTCAGYSDELVTQNGTVTEDPDEYGSSWRASPDELKVLDIPQQDQCGEVKEECVAPPPDQDLCYNIFNVDKFGVCHALVDPKSYVDSCHEELCMSPNADLCTILDRYAAECRRLDVCLDWRSPDLCPYSCTGDNVYRPCMKCQATCDDYEKLKSDPSKCDKPITEGCYCPEGKVRVNNTCIEPTKCFPCDAEHYVGDQWQEDACTKCSCSKLPNQNATHVSCTVQACTSPACGQDEDMIEKQAEFGQCCNKFVCVPKPRDNPVCDEPKKISCGFGQVLKQKTASDGCNEFVCECKPSSECDPLPHPNDAEDLEPGMERVVDVSGCCPLARLVCKPNACPAPPECPRLHTLETKNVTGLCCLQHSCELPKDKCVVTLQWEAAAKGGERPRATADVVLKDLDSVWWDGPCRSCRCERSAGAAPAAVCSHAECAPVSASEDMLMESQPVPFACCPKAVPVACRYGDTIYKVGENWTSLYDPCESYKCVESEVGKLEKVTTLLSCDTACQPGWKYVAANRTSDECCGQCAPVACVVAGTERRIGEKWTSEDFCTNYTCVNLQGTLQVQSANESCPEASEALRKQFVLREEAVPGRCCKLTEPVACRYHNAIYQEGQTWQSDDPCKNLSCARDSVGRLSITESSETCATDCRPGWRYGSAASGKCCGRCEQVDCVVDGDLRPVDSSWHSEDNCTTYACVRSGDSLLVTSSEEPCPDISQCAPQDRYPSGGCCQLCRTKPDNMKVCGPEAIPGNASVGLLKIRLGAHGVCTNKHPLADFKECTGRCASGTLYNQLSGSHDSKCECCQAVKYEPVLVVLSCEDGTHQEHRVASPALCDCLACGEGGGARPTNTGQYGTKTGTSGAGEPYGYEAPDIDARFPDRQRPK